MTIDTVIHGKLASIGAVYPVTMPQGATLPGMCYQFISEAQQRSHSGNSLSRRRLQVSCWGKTNAAAITLAASVKAALDLNQTGVELITAENMNDFVDPESGLYRRIVEFFVWD